MLLTYIMCTFKNNLEVGIKYHTSNSTKDDAPSESLALVTMQITNRDGYSFSWQEAQLPVPAFKALKLTQQKADESIRPKPTCLDWPVGPAKLALLCSVSCSAPNGPQFPLYIYTPAAAKGHGCASQPAKIEEMGKQPHTWIPNPFLNHEAGIWVYSTS